MHSRPALNSLCSPGRPSASASCALSQACALPFPKMRGRRGRKRRRQVRLTRGPGTPGHLPRAPPCCLCFRPPPARSPKLPGCPLRTGQFLCLLLDTLPGTEPKVLSVGTFFHCSTRPGLRPLPLCVSLQDTVPSCHPWGSATLQAVYRWTLSVS